LKYKVFLFLCNYRLT